ncbi:MAG: OsmC family protein [Geminicoccaceae bacterium]|nr:OsmC family protein [Geminicoccaceae bacterium]
MTEHHFACRLRWTGAAGGPTRDYQSFSRDYEVLIEGKAPIVCSSAAEFMGDPTKFNPEDMLVAALAGCHMLTYLALCARANIEVVGYEDRASGRMTVKDGKLRFTEVTLAPTVRIGAGDVEAARALHDKAHERCFIANSVNFPVLFMPTIEHA